MRDLPALAASAAPNPVSAARGLDVVSGFFRLCLLMLCCALAPAALAEEGEAPPRKVQYIEMEPPFVINFSTYSPEGKPLPKIHYLKTDVSLRVDTTPAADKVLRHMPALRNAMVLFLSRQPSEVIFDNTRHEGIRLEALQTLQDVLKEEEGDTAIEDLYFTNFLVQR